jgi:uncharacterized protein involved in exopolysaccharide biosynthesis
MSFPIRASRPIADAWRLVAAHPRRTFIPAAIVACAGLAYAAVGPETWQASWAVQIRDEAIGSHDRLGKFASIDSMKTAQETIQELAKSELVVAAALRAIGPPVGECSTDWPDADAIREAQDAVAIAAPNGIEFGETELIFIRANADSRERAVALDEALCKETERQLQALRRAKAQSLIDELDQRVVVARAELDGATERLATIEAEVGGDLGELRLLSESGGGESALRHSLIGVKTELRQATLKRASGEKLLELLAEAESDPASLVAAPNQLLDSLPTLRQLKDGLNSAKLRVAQATSRMTEKHPLVQSVLIELEEIKSQIRGEIAASKAGLKAELDLSDIAIRSLEEQRIDLETRMTRVAGLRAKYGNLTLETEKQSELLSEAVHDLIDAKSQHAAAEATSVLTFIGSPTTGGQPLPPGRSTVAVLSLIAGAFTGLGCLALTVRWRYVSEENEASATERSQKEAMASRSIKAMPSVEPSEVDYVRISREEFERLTTRAEGNVASAPTPASEATASERVSSVDAVTAEAPPSERIAPAPDRTSTDEFEWLEEVEIEIATPTRGAIAELRLPDSIRGRAHRVDLSGWGPLPDIYGEARSDDVSAAAEASEDADFFQTPANPESAEVSESSEEPSSPERSIQPAQEEPGDRPATPDRAPAFPARLYPRPNAKRNLSLRQALVTLSKRRPGRP